MIIHPRIIELVPSEELAGGSATGALSTGALSCGGGFDSVDGGSGCGGGGVVVAGTAGGCVFALLLTPPLTLVRDVLVRCQPPCGIFAACGLLSASKTTSLIPLG